MLLLRMRPARVLPLRTCHHSSLQPAMAARALHSHSCGCGPPSSSRLSSHCSRQLSSSAPDEAVRLLASAEVVATRHDRGWNFLLSTPSDAETPLDLAALRCAVPEEGAAILFGAQVLAPPQLGLSVELACKPLLTHALSHLAEVRRWQVVALVALPGLCEWVAALPDGALESEFGSEAGGAALAVALGRPRPGHSVLGQGTFNAAAPAWEALAERHVDDLVLAAEAAGGEEGGGGSELALYLGHGATRVGIAAMQDTSQEGIANAGGAMLAVAFPSK